MITTKTTTRAAVNGVRTLASLAAEHHAAAPLQAYTPPPVADTKTTAQWVQFGREHVTPGLGRVRDMVVVRGQGLEIETSDGDKILDFSSGIGVLSLGQ